jgi:four helix bundle protein
MSKINSFRDLVAWQRAMELADLAYDITEKFPSREILGLAFQLRKSAVSIPSNIAEGSRRRTPGYLYHLEVALGSHAELETQCELAFRRRFVAASRRGELDDLIAEVGRITHGLARSLDPNL